MHKTTMEPLIVQQQQQASAITCRRREEVHDDDVNDIDDAENDVENDCSMMMMLVSQLSEDDPDSIIELIQELTLHPHCQQIQHIHLDFSSNSGTTNSSNNGREKKKLRSLQRRLSPSFSSSFYNDNNNHHHTLPTSSSNKLPLLMKELGSLPNLQELTLSGLGGSNNGDGFPLQWISFFCRQVHRHQHNNYSGFQALRLRNCTIKASAHALQEFTKSLQLHSQHLHTIELWNCQLEEESRIFGSLDSILLSAGLLPQMSQLRMKANHCDRLGTLDSNSVISLLQPQPQISTSSCLKELQLKGFSWNAHSMKNIWTALHHHQHYPSCLQSIALDWCEFDLPATQALAKLMQSNTQDLNAITIGTSTQYVWNVKEFVVLIINALKYNTTITNFQLEHFDNDIVTFDNHGYQQEDHDDEKSYCSGNDIWNDVEIRTSIVEMLQTNLILHNLTLSTQLQILDKDFYQKMDLWLRLNKYAQRKLYHNKSEQIIVKDWIQILTIASHDLDCVFYILRQYFNPIMIVQQNYCN